MRANIFNDRFVATRAAIEKFGEAVIVAAHIMLLKEAKPKSGIDYLQVFEVDGEKLWFIDDVRHIACRLLRAYPNNWVVMRPSEKFEAKAAGQKCSEAWFSPR